MNKTINKNNHSDIHEENIRYAKENGWKYVGFKNERYIFKNKLNGIEFRMQPGESLENNATSEN
ncbi:hypothetical protein D3C87_1350800 [compost metagenome]